MQILPTALYHTVRVVLLVATVVGGGVVGGVGVFVVSVLFMHLNISDYM